MGNLVGLCVVGAALGCPLATVGSTVGRGEGMLVEGGLLGDPVGVDEGDLVGISVGVPVGKLVG